MVLLKPCLFYIFRDTELLVPFFNLRPGIMASIFFFFFSSLSLNTLRYPPCWWYPSNKFYLIVNKFFVELCSSKKVEPKENMSTQKEWVVWLLHWTVKAVCILITNHLGWNNRPLSQWRQCFGILLGTSPTSISCWSKSQRRALLLATHRVVLQLYC